MFLAIKVLTVAPQFFLIFPVHNTFIRPPAIRKTKEKYFRNMPKFKTKRKKKKYFKANGKTPFRFLIPTLEEVSRKSEINQA